MPGPPPERIPHVTRRVDVGEHRVHLRTGARPSAHPGPSFVLIHGYVISSRYFTPTLERLAPRYPTYALDLPGFGWSSKPSRSLSVPELADVVVATQAALGLQRSVFVGNSFGCQVVADLAARYPERVEAVVLTGPTFEPGRSLPHHVLGLIADVPLESPVLWALHVPDYVLAGPRRALDKLRHALDDQIEAKLPHIQAPTLVIRGSRDPIISREWPRKMALSLPHGRWAEIPGGPHCVNFSAPRELVTLIERFLQLESLAPPAAPGGGTAVQPA
ncbi:MAG TPA: alpha/beta hydrolase [Candidatus Limnocylindrales bacterium]|nr:alpha/beta hydrolase [Candidatus Limnocylindrales bacterium]